MSSFVSLFSGSSGNCTAVIDGNRVYLVDAGGSCKSIMAGLSSIGFTAADVAAVFVTHEHIDHIAALPVLLKYCRVPVFAGTYTAEYLENNQNLPTDSCIVAADAPVVLGDTEVVSFMTPHDSLSCCGYRFNFGNKSLAIATDIGTVTESVFSALKGCYAVALESNYDEIMLRFGKYPASLKRRILSDLGHLSNADCATTAAKLAQLGTKKMLLMHLSRDNNTPDMALTTTISEIESCGADEFSVDAAPRYSASRLLEV